eukprot:COSAG05_NODE_19312_length_294_cov_1.543590_1_plen_68_part_10
MGNLKNGRWPESWLEKIGHHSKYSEIFITELECLAILFCAQTETEGLRPEFSPTLHPYIFVDCIKIQL